VPLLRLSTRTYAGSWIIFVSGQREVRELFWTFEQATFATGLFFGRRRWISKAVDLYGSKAENRCASGRATFALPKPISTSRRMASERRPLRFAARPKA
jgi:hypothetical protein